MPKSENLDIRGVIFDADGLLLNTEWIAHQAWLQTGKEFGYHIPLEVHQQVIGLSIENSEKVMKRIYGEDFPYWTLRKRRLEIADEYIAQNGLPLKEGVLPLLDFLDQRGIPKAVATSSSRTAAGKKLAQAGIADRFAIVITNDDVPNGKPAPDIFITAATALNLSPANCLVLEDSEPGLKAAKAAGAIPVMVPDLKPPTAEAQQLAYRVFPSLNEVQVWLEAVLEAKNG
jgi:HAD superfamily hydrolase (TIGR01509 family)